MNLFGIIILLLLGVALINYAQRKATPQRKSRVTRSKGAIQKKPVSEKASSKSEKDYDKEYVEFQNMMLGDKSPYHDEYNFLKVFHDKLKNGEIFLEDMKSHAIDNYKKHDGPELMTKIELFRQFEHISTVFLNGWEERGETNFNGFVAIEQYHSLSQFMISTLGELLQMKLKEL